MNSFADVLFRRLEEAQFAEFRDNHDELRYGSAGRSSGYEWLKWQGRRFCRHFGWYHRTWLHKANSNALAEWMALVPELEWLYQRLADDASRALLVDIIAYRIMGPLAVRLPLSTQSYRNTRAELAQLSDPQDQIELEFMGWCLTRHNLSAIGYPMELYIRNPMTTFCVEQYALPEAGIRAEKGDVVLDGGACYGDTPLYFSHMVGSGGTVHAFEFIPSSMAILRRNLKLNPTLTSRVKIEEKALWDESGLTMYVRDQGPASKVSLSEIAGSNLRAESIAIDDYVANAGLDLVNFIKLDIEGAEEKALMGAATTIRTMRPKMAICLYHSPKDFVRLPRLLDELCPSYRFYLKHATMHQEETVLMARA